LQSNPQSRDVQSPEGSPTLSDFLGTYFRTRPDADFNICFFTHRQADPDALCSAYGLCLIVQKIFQKYSGSEYHSTIVCPAGASLLALAVAKKLGISYVERLDDDKIASCDLLILTDVGELQLLGEYAKAVSKSQAKRAILDHHGVPDENRWKGFDFVKVDPKSTSTSELVARETDSDLLDEQIARVLLAGLMFDSQHLGIANERTLEVALALVRKGARIDEAKSLLRSRPERSELIARLKSAQRLRFKELGPFFLAESEVSSFQAAVARMLVDIGADIGIAYGKSDGESRVSLRTSQKFFRETSIDLSNLVRKLSNHPNIQSGGHPTAAAVSGPFDQLQFVSELKQALAELIPQK
jgi:nanoRNase/pAp phosphatase (c-di-AMP/oligoRNAs hydrolase)